MITEIEIEGFKSFGSPPEKIRLGPLNFLVGANASGKSNLLSALEFLKLAVTHDVNYAVNELGGAFNLINRTGLSPNRQLRLRIAAESIKETIKYFEYEFTLDFDNKENAPIIVNEQLRTKTNSDNKEEKFEFIRNKTEFTITESSLSDFWPKGKIYLLPENDKARLLVSGVGIRLLSSIRFLIEQWRFFDISPNIARHPMPSSTSNLHLGKEGQYLADILHECSETMPKDSFGFGGADRFLQGFIPGFDRLGELYLSEADSRSFELIEDNLTGTIRQYAAADGVIRLLALFAIAEWVAKKGSLIMIEEPENGLHPYLAEHIVQLFREASEDLGAQFLITTHNPNFMNYLNPEEIILFAKNEGLTKTKRASSVEDIEISLKYFSLGELWEQGALGGIP
ncbi:MAG: ATP-binding protein [Candidatus Omnitrophota bacterium]